MTPITNYAKIIFSIQNRIKPKIIYEIKSPRLFNRKLNEKQKKYYIIEYSFLRYLTCSHPFKVKGKLSVKSLIISIIYYLLLIKEWAFTKIVQSTLYVFIFAFTNIIWKRDTNLNCINEFSRFTDLNIHVDESKVISLPSSFKQLIRTSNLKKLIIRNCSLLKLIKIESNISLFFSIKYYFLLKIPILKKLLYMPIAVARIIILIFVDKIISNALNESCTFNTIGTVEAVQKLIAIRTIEKNGTVNLYQHGKLFDMQCSRQIFTDGIISTGMYKFQIRNDNISRNIFKLHKKKIRLTEINSVEKYNHKLVKDKVLVFTSCYLPGLRFQNQLQYLEIILYTIKKYKKSIEIKVHPGDSKIPMKFLVKYLFANIDIKFIDQEFRDTKYNDAIGMPSSVEDEINTVNPILLYSQGKIQKNYFNSKFT